jgi:hypothetical protein
MPQSSLRVTRRSRFVFVILAAVLATAPQYADAASAPGQPDKQRDSGAPQVRVFEQHAWFTHDHGVSHPAATTYVDGPGLLAVAAAAGDGTRITLLDPATDQVAGRMRVPDLTRPVTLADNGRGRLAALVGHRFLSWPASARGIVDPRRRQVTGVGLGRPAGMTYDVVSRTWLVLDAAGHRLVRLVERDRQVRASNGPMLTSLGNRRLQGVSVDPASGLAYVATPDTDHLYALTHSGDVRRTLDTTDVGLVSLRTLAFGASADPTDSAGTTGLYATDAGSAGATTFGKVSEVSLTPLGTAAAAAPLASSATLVRKTLLSQLTPPSPDPAGVVYMSDQDRLLVADSEVDEMAIYQNVNLWQLSRAEATVLDEGNTLKFSREPTGIGYDPDGKRVFVSDDDKKKIFEVTTGLDNRYGTPDDSISSISTTAAGAVDAEDVTYDTGDHALYIADGTGRDVLRVDPGPNGRFDGIAPTGDDTVRRFDVSVYGITDLEGIGYSPTRDSLFLADRKFTNVVEVTTSGALVQTIDVASIAMKNPAAITLGPASNDPTKTSMYIVTRGVDNDNHPTENDGTMYELAAPNIGPINQDPNQAPSVSAGPDHAVSLPADSILDGTITDDGLPNPPGFTTATWTKVSGPGAVTFADPSSVDTTASFSAAGTYVLRLSATDSALTAADDVTVTASSTQVNTAPSVDAGSDQVVHLPSSASLQGIVTDDGLPNPPAATTLTWSKVSGPGAVTFQDPNAASTLAGFGESGTYVLRLTASDSVLSTSDDLTVTANPAPPTGNLVVNSGFEVDTSRWRGSTGTTLTRVQPGHSGDWAGQLVNTSAGTTTCQLNDSPDTVGTTVPSNYLATAWVKGDAASAGTTVRLRIREWAGQTLAGTQESSLTLSTGWQQLMLNYVPAAPGSSHLDVNLVRPTPAGQVCFTADDIFVMTTTQAPPNTPPSVQAGADQTVTLPDSAALSATVTDDGLPNPPAATTVLWSQVSGPGTVTFDNPQIKSTTARFSAAGSYVLRLSASDSELSVSDDLTVVVNPADSPPPSTNLVANPGLEADTSGWKGSAGTTLTRVQPGHSGDWAAQLVNTSATATPSCTLNDSPDTVSTTQASTYTAAAWVMGDAASAGTTVRLRIREYAGSTLVGTQQSSLTLASGWQQLSLAYVPTTPGSHLDVNLLRSTPAGATCLVVDDLSVTTS